MNNTINNTEKEISEEKVLVVDVGSDLGRRRDYYWLEGGKEGKTSTPLVSRTYGGCGTGGSNLKWNERAGEFSQLSLSEVETKKEKFIQKREELKRNGKISPGEHTHAWRIRTEVMEVREVEPEKDKEKLEKELESIFETIKAQKTH